VAISNSNIIGPDVIGGTSSSTKPEFEITEEMIQAGIAEFHSRHFGEDIREVLTDVFIAMRLSE